MKKNLFRYRPEFIVSIIFQLLILFAADSKIFADSQSLNGTDSDKLNLIFDQSHFKNLNPNDAVAALTVWVRNFSKLYKSEMNIKISHYDSAGSLNLYIEKEAADLVIINAKQFLQIPPRLQVKIDPIYSISVKEGTSLVKYHLVASAASGISGWKDIRNRDLLILSTSQSHLTEDWFRQSLYQSNLAEESVRVQLVHSVSKAILPVFFGQADACIVSDEAFELMKEINPQIGKKLSTVETSPGFTEVLICLRKGYHGDRQVLFKSLSEIHMDYTGRQVMLLFKINQLIPFEDKFLDNVRQLISESISSVEVNDHSTAEISFSNL